MFWQLIGLQQQYSLIKPHAVQGEMHVLTKFHNTYKFTFLINLPNLAYTACKYKLTNTHLIPVQPILSKHNYVVTVHSPSTVLGGSTAAVVAALALLSVGINLRVVVLITGGAAVDERTGTTDVGLTDPVEVKLFPTQAGVEPGMGFVTGKPCCVVVMFPNLGPCVEVSVSFCFTDIASGLVSVGAVQRKLTMPVTINNQSVTHTVVSRCVIYRGR